MKDCPRCGTASENYVLRCRCGYSFASASAEDLANQALLRASASHPPYFAVGPLKFCLMSVTTLGIYELYWFYQNWKIVREVEQVDISPFWRAFFAPFWTFSLGDRFAAHANVAAAPIVLPMPWLGVAYLLLSLSVNLPDPWWLFSMLSFVPILPFDAAARRLNGKGRLAEPTHGVFSTLNIIWLGIGAILLILVLIGAFLPPEAS
jgi:hypothetical protein